MAKAFPELLELAQSISRTPEIPSIGRTQKISRKTYSEYEVSVELSNTYSLPDLLFVAQNIECLREC